MNRKPLAEKGLTMRQKEAQLLNRIRKGDKKAFIELVNPYRERLYRKALSMVKDSDDAEDIVQDALISGFKSIENFRAESGVYTWLYRIVVNKSKDLLARKKRGKEKSIDETQENQFVDERESYEKKLELSEEAKYLKSKIDQLEDIYKEVIQLRYFDELSYSQIADILGCNIGTVKSRLFKAKEFLKHAILQDEMGDGYFEKP